MQLARIARLLTGLAALAAAQTPPVQESPESIRVNVEVVNVLCTVFDQHGALALNLTKDDFTIRENGVPQKIRYFGRETDLPLTLALLIDMSGSVRAIIQEEKDAASRFLDTILRPQDRAMLMGFSSSIIQWQDFTGSAPRLAAALEHMHAIPVRGLPVYARTFAGTLLYDAAYVTALRKLADAAGRKALVIISDGVDTGSEMTIRNAVDVLQSTNTVTYGICYEPPGGESGCSYLKNLATPTGGRSFKIGKKTPLTAVFHSIEDEIRSQYALGYVSSNQEHDGKFRKLDVRTRRDGYRIRTRKGYYAAGWKPPTPKDSVR